MGEYAYRKAEENLWNWFKPVAKIGFSGVIKVGSCATTLVLLKRPNERTHDLVVANAGDCRCIIGTGGKSKALTTVHNANNGAERRKLRDSHPKEKDVVQCQNGWKNRVTGEQIAAGRTDSPGP